jgi:hypothetical protein
VAVVEVLILQEQVPLEKMVDLVAVVEVEDQLVVQVDQVIHLL